MQTGQDKEPNLRRGGVEPKVVAASPKGFRLPGTTRLYTKSGGARIKRSFFSVIQETRQPHKKKRLTNQTDLH
jgi:hypothetical protein